MNGRVYDPVLGRFLSADPSVDGIEDAQGYNRYSYVGNNPLGATDPTGFFKLKDALKIVAIVVAGYFTAGFAVYAVGASSGATLAGSYAALTGGNLTLAGAISAGAGAGFGSGFAGSLLNGGSIGDAFKAGAIGAIVGGISGGIAHGIGTIAEVRNWGWGLKATAHGVTQGGITEVVGGEFRHGFYAGFFSSAISSAGLIEGAPGGVAGRVAAAAMVGGTASAIGGGKFANGAVSGAFVRLFNEEQHRSRFRRLYDELTDGAVAGPQVPWDKNNPHWRDPAASSALTGKKPGLTSIFRSFFSKGPMLGNFFKGGVLNSPAQVSGYSGESTRPLYTIDYTKNGRLVDVFYGFLQMDAGYSDMLRTYAIFEISGTLNGIWFGSALWHNDFSQVEKPAYRNLYQVNLNDSVEPIIQNAGRK